MSDLKPLHDFFQAEVLDKYIVYNSLFTNLPYAQLKSIAIFLPILHRLCQEGLTEGKTPRDIIDKFFSKHAYVEKETKQQDLLFLFIQFIERQVVLFDSIEDASSETTQQLLQEESLDGLVRLVCQYQVEEKIREKLRSFRVRVVFTAHPTQFYPSIVLRMMRELQEAIKVNDITQIDILLRQLSQTPFINREKPTPEEEADGIIYYMEKVYYDVVGVLNDKLHYAFFDGDADRFYPVLELGFWPGGDRDGNPFVNSNTTAAVSAKLKRSILRCYYRDLKKLCKRITFTCVHKHLEELCAQVHQNIAGVKHDLETSDQLLEKLEAIAELIKTKHGGLFVQQVKTLIRRVKAFGFHFASLDVRQDSGIHHQFMSQFASLYYDGKSAYETMPRDEKVQFLLNAPQFATDALPQFDNPVLQDTLATVKQFCKIQQQHGTAAAHRYIISNTHSIYQVLEVMCLFQICSCSIKETDITPLFESIADLGEAAEVMEQLYTIPEYRSHLKLRNNIQYIMLGFSDGTKDGGYVQSAWSIYRAKEKLSMISQKYGVHVIFFDGRGGPPSRGGGKTHRFYESQGSTIASNALHLTLQGQTITSQYGSVTQAMYSFEQLLVAGLKNTLPFHKGTSISESGRGLLDTLAHFSYKKYCQLKEHPLFLSYLEKKSALRYYGSTKIGSRPSKRGKDKKLTLKDLRAIPFVGSWAQLKQNVPGYFGFGYALQKLMGNGQGDELKILYNESLYFRTLVQNSIMSLAKTHFPLTAHMKNDQTFGGLWHILHEEYERSVKALLFVSNEDFLMESDVINRLSIYQRESMVLPLLVIQQYALEQVGQEAISKSIYEKIVMRTMFGIINASRNSA